MTGRSPALEERLAAYYRTLTPDSSLRLSGRAARTIREARATERVGGRVRFMLSLRGWGLIAAVGVVTVAVVLGTLRPLAGPAGPSTGTEITPSSSLPADVAESAVRAAGTIRSGGYWALRGSQLLTTTDWGATWRARGLAGCDYAGAVADPPVIMLDADHAWMLCFGGSSATDSPIAVARTVNGGRTWQQTGIGSGLRSGVSWTFSDDRDGYVALSDGSSGAETVLRTSDGGAHWQTAGTLGTAAGVQGWQLSASGPETVWAATAGSNETTGGSWLEVSRDGGATWSVVSLPGIPSEYQGGGRPAPPGPPVFFDPQHGVFAVEVHEREDAGPDSLVVFTTSDGGQTWARAGSHDAWEMPGPNFSAITDRRWVVVDGWTVATTEDAGAHWTDVTMRGISQPRVLATTGFGDASHGFGWMAVGLLEGYPLYLTSDGGRTWAPAQFGSALEVPSQPPSVDEAAVRQLVDDFEVARSKAVWASAWAALSPWSQAQFGSESAFERWQEDLNARGWWQYEVTTISQGTSNTAQFEPALIANLQANGDETRAYLVAVFHAQLNGAPEAKETLIVAPLNGGGWKVWLSRASQSGSNAGIIVSGAQAIPLAGTENPVSIVGQIENHTGADIRLVGGTSPAAASGGLYATSGNMPDPSDKTGMGSYRGMTSWLIPAGQSIQLRHGAGEIVLSGVAMPLSPGDQVEVTFKFESGALVTLTVPVVSSAG